MAAATPRTRHGNPEITLSLAIILLIGIASMLFIYNGLHTVGRIVHKLASLAEPTSAAAFEMEVNINGVGLAT